MLKSHRLQLYELGRLLQPPEGKKPRSRRSEKGSAAQGVEYIMEVHREASFSGVSGGLPKLFQLSPEDSFQSGFCHLFGVQLPQQCGKVT